MGENSMMKGAVAVPPDSSSALANEVHHFWQKTSSSSSTSIVASFDHFIEEVAPQLDSNFDHVLTKSELREGIDGNYVPEKEKPLAEFLINKMPDLQQKLDPNQLQDGLSFDSLYRLRAVLDPHYSNHNPVKDFIFTTEGGLCGTIAGMAISGALTLAFKGNLSMNFKIGMAVGALVGGAVGHYYGSDQATEKQNKSLRDEGLKNTLKELKALS